MIECYYDKCPYHYKDEPLCKKEMCRATTKNLFKWREERDKEIERNTIQTNG